jgi:transposase
LQPIGMELTERGHLVPAHFVVRRYEREKLACPEGHAVVTARAPEALVRRCKYEPSAYAHVAVSKYQDHLPLNRLQGIFKRQGVELSKQTMWDMLVTVDELVAQPVLEQCRKELLESDVLQSDESPVRMRLEDGKGSQETTAWVWRAPREEKPRKVLVRFELGKSRDGPKRMLGDWKGVLVSDGTNLHDDVARSNGIVRAGCMAHARRYFKKAFDVGAKEAALCLAPMNRLFWIERAVNQRAERLKLDLAVRRELRTRVRAQRSTAVMRRLYEAANQLAQKVVDAASQPARQGAGVLGEPAREPGDLPVRRAGAALEQRLRARPAPRGRRPRQLAGLRQPARRRGRLPALLAGPLLQGERGRSPGLHRGRLGARLDDAGEQDRRAHPLGLGRRARRRGLATCDLNPRRTPSRSSLQAAQPWAGRTPTYHRTR